MGSHFTVLFDTALQCTILYCTHWIWFNSILPLYDVKRHLALCMLRCMISSDFLFIAQISSAHPLILFCLLNIALPTSLYFPAKASAIENLWYLYSIIYNRQYSLIWSSEWEMKSWTFFSFPLFGLNCFQPDVAGEEGYYYMVHQV